MTSTTSSSPSESSKSSARPLPLAGLRVVEFTHMVMGPTCGMVLADLGAEVIKVEPVEGDNTRKLLGSGAGFFALFNRNKKSIALNLQKPEGREAALRLVATADVSLHKAEIAKGAHVSVTKLVLRDGRLVGAVLVGDTQDALWYSGLITSGTSVAPIRHDLAFGRAYAEAA